MDHKIFQQYFTQKLFQKNKNTESYDNIIYDIVIANLNSGLNADDITQLKNIYAIFKLN